MFCQNCGNQLPDGAKFCTRCGAPAAAPLASPTEIASAADPDAAAIFSLVPGVLTTLPSARGKRSNIVLAPTMGAQRAIPVIEQVLTASGFRQVDYRGEPIWKKGTGMMTAMQYVRVHTRGNLVALSAWVMMGVGSADFHEMPLTGALGAIPKKSLQRVLDSVRSAVDCS